MVNITGEEGYIPGGGGSCTLRNRTQLRNNKHQCPSKLDVNYRTIKHPICLEEPEHGSNKDMTVKMKLVVTIQTVAISITKTKTYSMTMTMTINYITIKSTNLSTEITRTRKVKMKLVVTISQVNLWSSALWLCRFDGLHNS